MLNKSVTFTIILSAALLLCQSDAWPGYHTDTYDQRITCLFDWTENKFPELFHPAPEIDVAENIDGEMLVYRCYQDSETCIAAWQSNYYYYHVDMGSELQNAGNLMDWYLESKCQLPELMFYIQSNILTENGMIQEQWEKIDTPYLSHELIRADLIRSTPVSHGKFKMEAVGKSFTITNIVARDLYNSTWVDIKGLNSNSGVINLSQGKSIEFELLSGGYPHLPSRVEFSFQEKTSGKIFQVIIDVRSRPYPYR